MTIQWSYKLQKWVSSDRAPAILEVSQRARAEALKKYQPSFGTKSQSPPVIYFHYQAATVFINWGSNPIFLEQRVTDCAKIQFLVIEDSVLIEQATPEKDMRLPRDFAELKELDVPGCRAMPCHAPYALGDLPVHLRAASEGGTLAVVNHTSNSKTKSDISMNHILQSIH